MKKKQKSFQADLMADTPYIQRNRDLNAFSYENLNNALNNYNNFTDAQKNQYQTVADQYTQSQWNDLNRNYVKQSNQLAARNQNRLGAQGATSNLYNNETLQRNYNDLASRVASQTASQYQNLVQQELANRYNTAALYSNLFQGTGNTTQAQDLANYEVAQKNKYNKWVADVQSQRSWIDYLTNSMKGSLQGSSAFSSLGPIGAIAGGIGGGITGLFDTYSNGGSNIGGGSGGISSSDLGNVLKELKGLGGK